jgi:hypothetical protein
MFCKDCGTQIPEVATFCPGCGASVDRPAEATEVPVGEDSSRAPSPSSPVAPKKKRSPWLWASVGVVAAAIVAVAVTVPLVVLGERDGEGDAGRLTSSTETVPSTSTSATTSASSAQSTNGVHPVTASESGDSPGEWVEMKLEGLPAWNWRVYSVVVSDEALLVDAALSDGTFRLYGYLFASKELVELPTSAPLFNLESLSGLLAVWWEGSVDEGDENAFPSPSTGRVYAYALPDGPLVDVTGLQESIGATRVAPPLISWATWEAYAPAPDEFYLVRIYAVNVDAFGRPQGSPIELIEPALARTDTDWVYDLSDRYLAWEVHDATGGAVPGTHVMDLNTGLSVGVDPAWYPQLQGDTLLCWQDSLMTVDLRSWARRTFDPRGGPGVAAPTYVLYPRVSPDESYAEIVARGFSGQHEQVLSDRYGESSTVTYTGSANHLAYAIDGKLRVFEWQPGPGF